MVDFSKLASRTPGEAKKPPLMPGGSYLAVIKQYEQGESKPPKKTPFVRYHMTLLRWPENAPDEWFEVDDSGKRLDYKKDEVDLAKRAQRFEFYFPVDPETGEPNEGGLYRFDEFIRSLDIPMDGMTYPMLFAAPVGKQVLVEIVQQLNSETNRPFTSIQRITGAP
jgi:hypothetical protein